MAPHVQRFCGLVAKAKLIDSATLEKTYRGWRAAAPNDRDNLRGFITYLLSHTSVTDQQVERLLTDSLPGTGETPVTPATHDDVEYEVVLVKARDPKRSLDRRDLLMLLGGAAGGAAAILVPAIIAMSINRRKAEDPEKPADKPEPQNPPN